MVARGKKGDGIGDSCRSCRRSFLTTRNPVIKDASATDLLKRRTPQSVQCRPCFAFSGSHPTYGAMSSTERAKHLEDEERFREYFTALQEWEELKRQGVKCPGKALAVDRAEAEQASSVGTKQVLGYLWTVPMLRDAGREIPKKLQSVNHAGKVFKGLILKEFSVGAIEINSTSSRTARRVKQVEAADSGSSEGEAAVEDTFHNMEKSLQISSSAKDGEIVLRRPKMPVDSDDEAQLILWGDNLFGGASGSGGQSAMLRCYRRVNSVVIFG